MPLAALIQHEQWFRALIEQSSDAITLVTAEGTILYASPAIARVTSYTAEELVGTNGFAFVHPDELERKPQRFNDLLDHPGKVITVEYRLRLKDGSWRWMEGTATNLLHDPVIGALVVNFRDITERKQAEEERAQLLAREQAARAEAEKEREALRQARQEAETRASELAAIFEAMTDGVVVSNSEGQARHTNAAFRAFFNLQADTDPESLLAHKRNAGAIPRDLEGRPLPKDQWAISRVLHGERLSGTNTMDLMCRTSEEQDMYFNASGAPILDDAGQIVGGVVVFRDVTERRRLEQQLQDSERKLRSLVESNIFGMIVSDAQGRIYEANECFAQMLGYSRDELLSETFNWHQLSPPDYQDAQARITQTILSTGALPPLERECLRKDGGRVPVLVGATMIDQQRQRALVVILDISEQKADERRKQDFLSMVSHELRTPLQSIMGFIELALLYRELLPSPLAPEAEELIGKIEMVLKRAMGQVNIEARLVEELLDVSRLETQTLDLALQRCNL